MWDKSSLYDIDCSLWVVKMYHKMTRLSLNWLVRRSKRGHGPSPDYAAGVTIRYAIPADIPDLRRLATLDSQPLPPGGLLLAEIAGEPWTAVSIEPTPTAVADPFRPTAELVALLSERARRLAMTVPPQSRPARRWIASPRRATPNP